MSYFAAILRLAASMVLAFMLSGVAAACPFCSAVAKTFSEEIDTVDVAVFARLTEAPKKAPEPDDNAPDDLTTPVAKAKFEVVQVLKGENHVKAGSQIEVLYFGDSPVGTHFLVLGVEPPVLTWATPIEVSDRAREYINQVMKLPKEGPDRLAFFLTYLEDKEEMLTRDAYDEFAKAPYADVKAIKDRIDHDQIVAWIWNPQVPASRKRLYMTMLGVCGGENDLLMLETMLKSEVREVKAGLDATIACYLTLKGPDGMPLVEELFLKNKDAEYTDTYAAIMALRFHGQENDLIPKERIKVAFRHMLDRPKLADLIIPDLARWEDWYVMERMVTLFKEADTESSWVRVPVVNYLRASPLPKAKIYIEELAQIDPDAVKRASSYFPLGAPAVPAPGSRPPTNPVAARPAGEGTTTDTAAAAAADPAIDIPPPALEGPIESEAEPAAQSLPKAAAESVTAVASPGRQAASEQAATATARAENDRAAQLGLVSHVMTVSIAAAIILVTALLTWSITRNLHGRKRPAS